MPFKEACFESKMSERSVSALLTLLASTNCLTELANITLRFLLSVVMMPANLYLKNESL